MADSLAMVRLLLSAGADVTLTTYSGRSVLDMAISSVMADFLKAYLVDLNGGGADRGEEEIPWDLAPVWDGRVFFKLILVCVVFIFKSFLNL